MTATAPDEPIGNWREWIKRGPVKSLEELAEERRKPLRLSDYQRTILATQFDHYGDEMRRLLEERGEAGHLTCERAVWMAEQVDGWYTLADAVRCKRVIK